MYYVLIENKQFVINKHPLQLADRSGYVCLLVNNSLCDVHHSEFKPIETPQKQTI